MRNLNKAKSGSGGEVQLTDAIAQEIVNSDNVYGFHFRGQRYDCGSKAGFLQATVAFGLAREDLGDDLRQFLQSHRAPRPTAECRVREPAPSPRPSRLARV